MILRTILAGLLLSAFTLRLPALDSKEAKKAADAPAKPEAKSDGKKDPKNKPQPHVCALNITWWAEPNLKPGESLELGILIEKEFQPIYLQAMTIGRPLEYTGEPNVVIGRKTKVTTTDKKGKPVTTDEWVPFANFTISETDTDILALLMLAPDKPVAIVKTFDIGVTTFPYGTIHIFNYTKAKIGCNIDGTVFFAQPGQRGKVANPFTARQVVNFRLAAIEADGEPRSLVSSPMVVDHRARRLYFVSEIPNATDEARYRINALIDHIEDHPQPKPEEEVVPAKKAEPKESKKSAERPATK